MEFIHNLLKALFGSKTVETDKYDDNDIISEAPLKAPQKSYSHVKILIDNGHGNNTAGKRSPYSLCGVEPAIDFYEYKWCREIAKEIVEELKQKGYNADLLVPEDIDISLTKRVNRVNNVCKNLERKMYYLFQFTPMLPVTVRNG